MSLVAAGCCASYALSWADKSAQPEYLGLYEDIGVVVEGRPVFENDQGRFLFNAGGVWTAGPDYQVDAGGVYAGGNSACPPPDGYDLAYNNEWDSSFGVTATCTGSPFFISPIYTYLHFSFLNHQNWKSDWPWPHFHHVTLLFSSLSQTATGTGGEPCDASTLLELAADLGDCSSELASRDECTNTAIAGKLCTASTCLHGILTEGACGGPFISRRVIPSLSNNSLSPCCVPRPSF